MSRILVVDDSPFYRRRVRAVLEREGHEVTEARDVRGAVQCVFLDPPDAVVLDLLVPDRAGLELLEELRRRDFAGPVVVLTADRQPMTRHLATTHGATEVLTEPVDVERLLSLLPEAPILA